MYDLLTITLFRISHNALPGLCVGSTPLAFTIRSCSLAIVSRTLDTFQNNNHVASYKCM